MNEVRSTLAPGHIVLHVEDLTQSVVFYRKIGLPAFSASEAIALIELRGGTHIILAVRHSDTARGAPESRHGQMGYREALDVMIDSDARADLEVLRQGILSRGIEATEIDDERYFGHYWFRVDDPDGHGITFYTSHEIKYWEEFSRSD